MYTTLRLKLLLPEGLLFQNICLHCVVVNVHVRIFSKSMFLLHAKNSNRYTEIYSKRKISFHQVYSSAINLGINIPRYQLDRTIVRNRFEKNRKTCKAGRDVRAWGITVCAANCWSGHHWTPSSVTNLNVFWRRRTGLPPIVPLAGYYFAFRYSKQSHIWECYTKPIIWNEKCLRLHLTFDHIMYRTQTGNVEKKRCSLLGIIYFIVHFSRKIFFNKISSQSKCFATFT